MVSASKEMSVQHPLKIDIEGAEPEPLPGMQRLLDMNVRGHNSLWALLRKISP